MRKRVALLALYLSAACGAQAQAPSSDTVQEAASRIALWPGGIAPGSRGVTVTQAIVDRSRDPAHPDRIITGITRPYLVAYRPPHPDGTALLVTPGGGYQRIVLDKEGATLAPVFANQAGVTLFVLRYRLPGEGHDNARDAPLADAQRALRLIHSCAPAWGLDRARIGAMGFSAGGHVAASLATRFDEAVYAAVDAHDAASARPDFVVLGYPVIDMAGEAVHAGSRERLLGPNPSMTDAVAYSLQNRVTKRTPPTFLLHAADDEAVPVENSLLFHAALREAGVPAELHIYAQGGHGFGVHAVAGQRLAEWPRLALDWMRSQPGHARTTATAPVSSAANGAACPVLGALQSSRTEP